MAGANRVIDLYEVSAKRIHNTLDRPIATKLLDGFLSTTSKISFKEISLPFGSPLEGVSADKINYRVYGILPIGISNSHNSASFTFATSFDTKVISAGDTLICMGRDDDLERFEQKIEKMEHIKWK
jgi:voltage-gated potassium channel